MNEKPIGPARRPQAERRDEAERRLLDAAVEIVARRGASRMTLAEVGEAAGYSRGLPGHHFGNKAGLLRAVAAQIHRRFAAQLRSAPSRKPGLDALRGWVNVYFNRKDWVTTRALLVLMTEGFMDDGEMRQDMASYGRRIREELEREIRIGMESGEIRPDAQPGADAALLIGAMRGVLLQWLLDEEIDLIMVRDRLLTLIDRFLAGPGGEGASST